jgi:hypothetical protein
MLAQPLVVLPAHYLRAGDSIGWSARAGDVRAYLAAFDSTLEHILKERGAPDTWRFPPSLAVAAQRNAGYLSNPYQLAAQGLRPTSRRAVSQLTDPLVSQVRAWAAQGQARVALLPVEIRFEGRSDSARAVIRVAVLDAPLGRVRWMSDVRSEPGSEPGGEVLRSLARHVADLVTQQ